MSGTEPAVEHGSSRSRGTIDRFQQALTAVTEVARATAFWLAVVLPAVYLPLLVTEPASMAPIVSTLLVVHILCVLFGAGHDPKP